MRAIVIITGIVAVGCFVALLVRKRRVGDSMDRFAAAAVARGNFQFLALLHEDGAKTLPEVPGIPAWYFETTGVNLLTVRPETEAPKLALRMKSYNDALYQALKAQGKFHIIEADMVRVRKNLDAHEQSQKSN